MNGKHGPMFQRAIDRGQLKSNTPARIRMEAIIDRIPKQNRNLSEAQLREAMRQASRSGKEIHYLDDGERASVMTNVTARFPPHYRDEMSMKKLDQVEALMQAAGYNSFVTGCITIGRNEDGNQMNFEIVVPKRDADLLLTSGMCFFPKIDGELPDGFIIILPESKERTVNISKMDCAAIVEGTNYPGNAGKKTIMTIAGYVASKSGLIMEHFGLGEIAVRNPESGEIMHFNIKVGGASFTGKSTTLTGYIDERAFGPGEFRMCYNDDMIFTDPKTGKSYGMEWGNFFTCSDLTPQSNKYLWEAHKDLRVIGYNIVVENGAFAFSHPKSDPNARLALPRIHRAISPNRYNTSDTEHSSGRLDVSMQLFRGPHFPPGFIIKDPEMAAVLLAAGPTQKTAAQVGGSAAAKVKGYCEFKPILDEGEFEARKVDKENPMSAIEVLFEPAFVEELLKESANKEVPISQFVNDLFVSGFIMERPADYMEKLLDLYTNIPITHLGMNTGYGGPVIANVITHPFDGPTVRVYDMSVAYKPVISQDLLVHTLRGEIKTEYDPLLQVDVIVMAGGVDYTPILPRTLYKQAGIDYETAVRKAYSRYADFLEQNGLENYAKRLRNGKSS